MMLSMSRLLDSQIDFEVGQVRPFAQLGGDLERGRVEEVVLFGIFAQDGAGHGGQDGAAVQPPAGLVHLGLRRGPISASEPDTRK